MGFLGTEVRNFSRYNSFLVFFFSRVIIIFEMVFKGMICKKDMEELELGVGEEFFYELLNEVIFMVIILLILFR